MGADFSALWLSVKLAFVTTVLLLVIATPLSWHLARTRGWWKHPLNAFVTLPFVLPPTVLGFYLLTAMGPNGPLGKLCTVIGLPLLPFTFSGLVIASLVYSLPFVVSPLENAFTAIGNGPLEAAATLRSSPLKTFFSVVLPLAKPAYLTAAVMGFAHTIGEFGVVLMIGGNIPDKTRLVSVAIYDYVEDLDYASAHTLAGFMLAFAFAVLLALYLINGRKGKA